MDRRPSTIDLTTYLTELSEQHAHAIPFERYMREALYHPDFGYYTAHVDTIGRGGDFSTAATLHPILAQALAAFIEDEVGRDLRARRAETSSPPWRGPGRVPLVELGPGDGSLARHLLDALPRRLRRKIRLHLVEISPLLRARQRETLKKYRKQITWHEDIDGVIESIAGEPVIVYSNELVDAFPATVYEHDPATNSWQKLHLAFDPAKGLRESLLPAGDEGPATGDFPHPTQRIEVHESYRDWLGTWIPRLGEGTVLLTIDYGDTVENLYHRRPNGTLRAYFRHQRHEGPAVYARFGKQDLTADVNFTDLIAWSDALGLETLSLHTQREFILERLPDLDPFDPALQHVVDRHGAGDAFKVLIQKAAPASSSQASG